VPFWSDIEGQIVAWNNETEHRVLELFEFPQKKRIVLVTHDESIFYTNCHRKTCWMHGSEKALLNPKGEGASIMVSDFCPPDLGWLWSKDGKEEAQMLFKAGKDHDGYSTNEDLIIQTEKTIELLVPKKSNWTHHMMSHAMHAAASLSTPPIHSTSS